MPRDADPTCVVADADLLAADVFIDGPAREAMDIVWAHSWIDLVASAPLLAEATAVIERLGTTDLAGDWEAHISDRCRLVEVVPGDLAPLATAYAGRAGHLLTYDDRLTTADAGLAMRRAMPLSIRTPEAFIATVDPAALYEATHDGSYPGPDRDPRR